jgi:hypothetical protein
MPPSLETTTVPNTGNFITKYNFLFIFIDLGFFMFPLRGWQQVVFSFFNLQNYTLI